MSNVESFIRDLLNYVDKAKLLLYHDINNIKKLTETVKNDMAEIANTIADVIEMIDRRTHILKGVQRLFRDDTDKIMKQFSSLIAEYQNTLFRYNQNVITLDKTIVSLDENLKNFKSWLVNVVHEMKDIRADVMSAKKTSADINNILIASLVTNGLLILYVIFYILLATEGGK